MVGTCDRCVDAGRSVLAVVETLSKGLADQGLASPRAPSTERLAAHPCEPIAWAASGAMALTGWPDAAPRLAAGAPVTALLAAATLLEALSREVGAPGDPLDADPRTVLSGRAGLLGLARGGRTSASGTCRLLRCRDGWVAVNLPRATDLELLAAVVGEPAIGDGWEQLAAAAVADSAAALSDRAQVVGIPASVLLPQHEPDVVDVPVRVVARGRAPRTSGTGSPLVVDLSSMWAGPLCARLLGRRGARVVKVESTARPDGARSGPAPFFDWLHGGHRSVAVDFTTARGRGALAALLDRADVVIEASRPRALRQLGIDAEGWVADHPSGTWVGVTGHGRTGDASSRVAFGDDGAVAGGLVARDEAGDPVFCGDAIADPLTGVYAALATLASIASGGGHLLDVSLARVAAFAAGVGSVAPPAEHQVEKVGPDRWLLHHCGWVQEVLTPARLVAESRAPRLGAHTRTVLAEMGVSP